MPIEGEWIQTRRFPEVFESERSGINNLIKMISA
jgi:hypothetical protein